MKFCVFILTHGRPGGVVTYGNLRKFGYTGPIRLVIDDEDNEAERYKDTFPGEVIQFSKEQISQTFDEADNFSDRRSIVYARNACFDIAKNLGCYAFAQFDDDYTEFKHRVDADGYSGYLQTRSLDDIFTSFVEYLESAPQIQTLAFAQGGDYIGGEVRNRTKRKVMNSFVCLTARKFQFIGRINEDVNYYTLEGSRGRLNLSVMRIQLDQKQTQSNNGGMTDIYKAGGTYIKSFYSVMMMPSAVKISVLHDGSGSNGARIHHRVNWNNCVPKIVRESV